MYFFKRVLLWCSIVAALYLLLGYHFIFFGGTNVRMLKKPSFTLENTFFSVHGKSNATILQNDGLRESGIADLLVDMGEMSERERSKLMARYD